MDKAFIGKMVLDLLNKGLDIVSKKKDIDHEKTRNEFLIEKEKTNRAISKDQKEVLVEIIGSKNQEINLSLNRENNSHAINMKELELKEKIIDIQYDLNKQEQQINKAREIDNNKNRIEKSIEESTEKYKQSLEKLIKPKKED